MPVLKKRYFVKENGILAVVHEEAWDMTSRARIHFILFDKTGILREDIQALLPAKIYKQELERAGYREVQLHELPAALAARWF